MNEKTTKVSAALPLLKLLRPKDNFRSFLSNGVRFDGRLTSQMRPIAIQSNTLIEKGNHNSPILGSSQVRIGGTTVVASIHALVGTPRLTHPKQGELGKQQQMFTDDKAENSE